MWNLWLQLCAWTTYHPGRIACLCLCNNKTDVQTTIPGGYVHDTSLSEDVCSYTHRRRENHVEGTRQSDSATTYIEPITSHANSIIRYFCFFSNDSNIHKNTMLPKLGIFVLLNKGSNMKKKDDHWSMIKYGDDGACRRNKNEVSSGVFNSLKSPWWHTRT